MIDMVDKMSNKVAVVSLKHIKYNIEKAREKDDSIDIFGCDRKALDMAIKALEQTRWIPVEERNPDKTGVYLATIKYLNRYDEYCYMIVKRSYYANVGTWDDSLVVAWMPLPEPYSESEVR